MSVVVDRLAEAIRTVSSTEKEHDPDSAARAALNELAAIVDESWEAYADATNIPGWTAAPRCSDGCLPCLREWLLEVAAS